METNLTLQLEALIFASPEPITKDRLQAILSKDKEEPVSLNDLDKGLEGLKQKYDSDAFAFKLAQTGGGFQFLTKSEFHPLIAELNGDKYNKKLSATSMETLSIIAYKQPVTKGEIEYIRGVASDYSVQKLLEKDLIYIMGRKEDAIGKPLLYATTPFFMDYLGINDPSELPKMKEIVQSIPVEATPATEALPEAKIEE